MSSQIAPDFKHSARRQFDGWAKHYDRSLLHFFLFRPSYLLALEETARWLATRDGTARLLDIGCGTGEFLSHVARAGWDMRCAGLDYSASMTAHATAKFATHEIETPFVTADSEHIPFADRSFDIITCLNSFHHYPNQQNVVHEMRRVLRPGGRLILIDGFRDNVLGWVVFDVVITRVERDVFHAPWHLIHTYFENAGFRTISRRKINLLFPVLATVGDLA